MATVYETDADTVRPAADVALQAAEKVPTTAVDSAAHELEAAPDVFSVTIGAGPPTTETAGDTLTDSVGGTMTGAGGGSGGSGGTGAGGVGRTGAGSCVDTRETFGVGVEVVSALGAGTGAGGATAGGCVGVDGDGGELGTTVGPADGIPR